MFHHYKSFTFLRQFHLSLCITPFCEFLYFNVFCMFQLSSQIADADSGVLTDDTQPLKSRVHSLRSKGQPTLSPVRSHTSPGEWTLSPPPGNLLGTLVRNIALMQGASQEKPKCSQTCVEQTPWGKSKNGCYLEVVA